MAPFSELSSQSLQAKNLTIESVVKDIYEMQGGAIHYGANFFEKLNQHTGPLSKSIIRNDPAWLTSD